MKNEKYLTKKAEITLESIELLKNEVDNIMLLRSEQFSDIINRFLQKGIKGVDLREDNLCLMKNLLNLAKSSNRSDEIQDMIKDFLKELNKRIIEEL